MSTMGLAEQLRRIREVKNVSLREVEKATGISNAYLSQIESGNATNPSPHRYCRSSRTFTRSPIHH